ncbi:MAG TPA: carboxypeptidase-like regulatory domain-containing protein [Rubricoccaceae bacterium]
MRPVLLALCLVAAGCGSLVPYRYAPSRLMPDVSPRPEGSSAVVTARVPGVGAVEGRVLDRDTGAALAGVRVASTGPDGTTTEARTDVDGAFRIARVSGVAALRADHACHAPLDARPGVGSDTTATVLVLMAPVTCEEAAP